MIDLSWINDLPENVQRELFEGPAMMPPEGVTPNFVNPSNKNDLARGILITSTVLIGILVALRIYSRAFVSKKLAIEDYATLIAAGCFAAFFYYVWQILTHHGLFVHQYDTQLKDIKHLIYNLVAASTVYAFVLLPIKVGILIEWTKIFVPRGVRNKFWWICCFTLAFNVIFYLISTFIIIFGCSPRHKMWDVQVPGKCLDAPRVNVGSAIINLLSDIIILLLPQKIIWGLQLSFSKKLGVATVFAIGILASICAAWRIHSAMKFATDADMFYAFGEMAVVACFEMTLGFFVLCLPSLPKIATEYSCLDRMKSNSIKLTRRWSEKPPQDSTRSGATVNIELSPKAPDRVLFGDFNKSDTVPLTEPRISYNPSLTPS